MYYNDAHVDLQMLQIALQRALQLRPELRIAIQADKSAQQGQVVEVMDTAKAIGIERVAIATAPMRTPQ
jgi:biopolymer transport protein ExbD